MTRKRNGDRPITPTDTAATTGLAVNPNGTMVSAPPVNVGAYPPYSNALTGPPRYTWGERLKQPLEFMQHIPGVDFLINPDAYSYSNLSLSEKLSMSGVERKALEKQWMLEAKERFQGPQISNAGPSLTGYTPPQFTPGITPGYGDITQQAAQNWMNSNAPTPQPIQQTSTQLNLWGQPIGPTTDKYGGALRNAQGQTFNAATGLYEGMTKRQQREMQRRRRIDGANSSNNFLKWG